MSRIVALGEVDRLWGLALAGADVAPAEDPAAARAAWGSLGADVGLVILTPAARAALGPDELGPRGQRLWVVMPV